MDSFGSKNFGYIPFDHNNRKQKTKKLTNIQRKKIHKNKPILGLT